MTSQLNVDTIVDKAGSGGTNVKVANTSSYVSDGGAVTQNTVQGVFKAWSNVASHSSLNDSFNVASVTDQGTGQSNDNFTNVFANTNYCITYGSRDGGGTNDDRVVVSGSSEQYTTGKYGIYFMLSTTLNDAEFIFLQYAGDLA